jgi:hypothetical protein
MIARKRRNALVLCLAFAMAGAVAPARGLQRSTPDAQAIIERYFEAIGGRDKIESVQGMVIHGRYGNVYAPGDTMTLYLKKPDMLRRETFGLTVTYDGHSGYINSFGDLKEAEGDNLTSLRYYAGFFHNCFSLLKFGDSLRAATFAGERTLGPQREYVVIIPYEGIDYTVHFVADTYLIDRIVFPFGDPQRGTRMVNSLSDYKEVNGIMIPMDVTFDVVGRESAGMKLEPLNVELVDDLDDSMFGPPEMDIKPAAMEGGMLSSEVFDDSNGILLTTVRRENMEKLGITPGEFMTFRIGQDTMSVRYVENIHSGFKGAQLGDYIAIYYGTPFLAILMFGEGQLSDVFPFEKGQRIEIWPTKGGVN